MQSKPIADSALCKRCKNYAPLDRRCGCADIAIALGCAFGVSFTITDCAQFAEQEPEPRGHIGAVAK